MIEISLTGCRATAGAFVAVLACAASVAPQSPRALHLTTSDGVRLTAYDFSVPAEAPRPYVLLFHQAGASALGEYTPIVPRLVEAGYDVLAVDLRSGGGLFGGVNRTVEARGASEEDYCRALPDLNAALTWAREARTGSKPVLWGSSYSAALVIQLAATRPGEVQGVLSFSPASGEPMAGCLPEPYARELRVPLVAFRPKNEAEIPSVAEQLDALRAMGHEVHVLDPARHGSSALVAERVGAPTDEAWTWVLAFLERMRQQGG